MRPHPSTIPAALAVFAVMAVAAPSAQAQWAFQGAPQEDIFTLCIGAVGDKVFHQSLRGIHARGPADTAWGLGDGLRGACIAMVRHGSDLVVGYGDQAKATGWMARTRDSGKTWEAIGKGYNRERYLIPFGHGNDLYAAADTAPDAKDSGDEIFKLDTATGTWVKRGALPVSPVNGFVSLGPNLFAISKYYGLFLSRDSGATWSADLSHSGLSLTMTGITALGSRLFISTHSGLYTADADGAGWISITGTPRISFTAVGRSGSRLFAASKQGLFRSDDSGKTWIIPTAPLTGRILRMAIGDGRTSFVEMESKGFFATHDDGDTWTRVPLIQEPADLQDFQAAGNALAGLTISGASGTALAMFGRLRVSTDQGRTWSLDGPDSITAMAARKEGVLALQATGQLDLRRPDGTWERVSPGSPDAFFGQPVATPEGDLVACSWKGPWRFGDPAAGWVPLKGNLPDTLKLTWVESSGGLLFVGRGSDPEGLASYRSADGGRTWSRCDSTFGYPYSMAGTGSTHLLQRRDVPLLRSLDEGRTWSRLETVPRDSGFEAQALLAREGILHIGGTRGRIWTSGDHGQTWALTQVEPRSGTIMEMAVMEGDFYAYASSKGLYRLPGLPGRVAGREGEVRIRAFAGPVRRGASLLFPADPRGSAAGRRADGRFVPTP